MEDDLAALDGRLDRGRVGQGALDDLGGASDVGEVGSIAGAEVVEHADRPTGRGQGLDQVRTDEPRTARDQAQSRHANLTLPWNVTSRPPA